jgi:hypothetical protein
MTSCTSWRFSSGQALNSSGGTTFPSRSGANAKPIGVRRIAMPLAAAFSWSAENASACFDWKA